MHFSIIFYVMNALDRLKSKKCESLPKKIATNVIFRLTSYVLTLIWNIQVAVFVYQCTSSLQLAGVIFLTRSTVRTVQYAVQCGGLRRQTVIPGLHIEAVQCSRLDPVGTTGLPLLQSIGSRELILLHRKFV